MLASQHDIAEPVRFPVPHQPGVAGAVWHSLVWLVIGNAIGVMLAVLLLLPGLNPWLGEWTYGRWMMVHMNVALYGWCSLPMIGFLFKVYGADRGKPAAWCRAVLWLWSGALIAGSISWLSGQSSGKLFLDWSGYARIALPAAMLVLWLLLAASLVLAWNSARNKPWSAHAIKIIGLAILFAVPFAIYIACGPGLYPAINPATGGPTGESQLESSLGVVAILLIVPYQQHGARVVHGQRMMQAASDIYLGWTKGLDVNRHFYWRQLRDMKGSVVVETMAPVGLTFYARICGWTLARAHARSGDPVALAAYLGASDAFDKSITDFSQRYADQNEQDYEAFVKAVRSGRLQAVEGV